jgi:transposase
MGGVDPGEIREMSSTAFFGSCAPAPPWHNLPERYPPYQTCHRRFQKWVKEGVLERVLKALVEDLQLQGGLDLSECYIDGTIIGAKKGEKPWARLSGVRARS